MNDNPRSKITSILIAACSNRLTVLVVLTLLYLSDSARAVDYSAVGTLRCETYRKDRTVSSTQVLDFRVTVEGSKWHIFSHALGADYTVDYQDICDGQQTMSLSVDHDNGPLQPTSQKPCALVSQGSFPESARVEAKIIWLALASGSHVQKHRDDNRAFPSAPWVGQRYVGSKSFNPILSSFGQHPFLPESISFVTNLGLWKEDLDEHFPGRTYALGSTYAIPDYVANQSTGGVYSVTGTTNFAGFLLPTAFNFKRFATTGYLFQSYIGEVKEFRRNADAQLALTPTGEIAVNDLRFADSEHPHAVVGYSITNAGWPVIPAVTSLDLSQRGDAARRPKSLMRRVF